MDVGSIMALKLKMKEPIRAYELWKALESSFGKQKYI